MAGLTREQIFAADDKPRREVECPEWGGSVWVRTLSELEVSRYQQSMLPRRRRQVPDLTRARVRLVILATVDEQGTQLFGDADQEALQRRSPAPMERVFQAAKELNGLVDEDGEEARKN